MLVNDQLKPNTAINIWLINLNTILYIANIIAILYR